ncbi:hypothetical protein [Gluconobacter frateurii]|nr:hypothetical protein [Gluconobacter frateurii]GLP89397.1 hypothetical protein GCM10007868_04720 [Gluconobacter frateurii]
MKDLTIKVSLHGNTGNIMMMYLSALKLQSDLGYGTVCNVRIPLFNISIPDIDTSRSFGIHDREYINSRVHGRLSNDGYRHILPNSNAAFISLEGYSQHVENFPDRRTAGYEKLFPFCSDNDQYGGPDDLVINIRGGEILTGLHPDYTVLPPEFYEHLIQKTGKKPIFYGQLTPSPYLDELKQRFPGARFIASRGEALDFDYIRRSHYIVPALSTFSWLAAWLSDAKKIFFPVAGVLSPKQHRSSMLLPFDDPRYEFYVFPIYHSRDVSHYREYLDPVRTAWQYVPTEELRQACACPNKPTLNDALSVFSVTDYLNTYGDISSFHSTYGAVGLINHFCSDGFWEGKHPVQFDDKYYANAYPSAAMDVAMGRYDTLLDHYMIVGHKMGYKPRA